MTEPSRTEPSTAQPAAIELRALQKSFGSEPAVRGVDLRVEPGEFFSLLGPSGCGKTTTLRMMAGFEQPDDGTIWLHGRDVTGIAARQRSVNLVFQKYELFPHMTVYENVAFGLRVKRVSKGETRTRVAEMLEVTGVAALTNRRAEQLSGGQQQRVALARALVNRPEVLLLDEPLSALDAKLRKRMQVELKEIQSQLGTTFLYVTHDQEEALLMSDRIGVMNEGLLEQVGTPMEIYDAPATPFVADFIGATNLLRLTVDRSGADEGWHSGQGARVRLPGGGAQGEKVLAVVRPERVVLERAPVDRTGTLVEGKISAIAYGGAMTQYTAETALGALTAATVTGISSLGVAVGDPVVLSWPDDALRTVVPQGAS